MQYKCLRLISQSHAACKTLQCSVDDVICLTNSSTLCFRIIIQATHFLHELSINNS